jgi:hypothetical protein
MSERSDILTYSFFAAIVSLGVLALVAGVTTVFIQNPIMFVITIVFVVLVLVWYLILSRFSS